MPNIQQNLAKHLIPLTLLLFIGVLYSIFAYDLERTDFLKLGTLYLALFIVSFVLIISRKISFNFFVAAGIIFRLLFLLASPNLSQDFYRFIWDGQMILEGFNPYLHTPDSIVKSGDVLLVNMEALHNGMGELSASHFSNYPPLNQFLFVLANLFPGQSILSSIIGLRLIIILADLGVFFFGLKLLKYLKLPSSRIFWYFLNPFIIIELTGNLHFEGVMACFLILSVLMIAQKKWFLTALFFSFSIATKLLPLILIPLLIPYISKDQQMLKVNTLKGQLIHYFKAVFTIQTIRYVIIILVVNLVLFAPFISKDFLNNYSSTIALWFGNFEFNASIYYIARAIGYSITGYNQISIISKILPAIIVLIIILVSIFRRRENLSDLMASMVIVISSYLFLSTTVHPWYLTTIVALSMFCNYKFAFAWSFLIVVSYWAYGNSDYTENFWLIALEYGVVFTLFCREVFLRKRASIRPLR